MANKAKVDLTKEEIGVIVYALDILEDADVVYEAHKVEPDGLVNKLTEIYYRLRWRDE